MKLQEKILKVIPLVIVLAVTVAALPSAYLGYAEDNDLWTWPLMTVVWAWFAFIADRKSDVWFDRCIKEVEEHTASIHKNISTLIELLEAVEELNKLRKRNDK